MPASKNYSELKYPNALWSNERALLMHLISPKLPFDLDRIQSNG